jgi:hypothetical protein
VDDAQELSPWGEPLRRYVVWPYLRLATGPGNPRGILSVLASFVRGPHSRVARWGSSYSVPFVGKVSLPRWRWGAVVWGLDFVEATK